MTPAHEQTAPEAADDRPPVNDTARAEAESESRDALAFAPTLREVMVRPQWIAMLVLCLVIAAVLAALGQWQLESAIDTDPPEPGATEEIIPIDQAVAPGEYLREPLGGQRVAVTGRWDADDFLIVSSRYNDGVEGYWVTGRLELADASSLAVAIGWADSRERAEQAVETFLADVDPAADVDLVGRVIADEGPAVPPRDAPYEMTRMSPAALLGQWTDTEGPVYRAYLTSDDATGGIADADVEEISSPAPDIGTSVNWLNIFYAIEWAIFAGFALYLWYRLAKDAWEKELEEIEGVDPDE